MLARLLDGCDAIRRDVDRRETLYKVLDRN